MNQTPLSPPTPPELSLGRKLVFSAVLLLILFGLLEGGLRIRAWMRYGSTSTSVRDPMLRYDPAADLYVPVAGYAVSGQKLNIRINSLGFRGDEIVAAKPPGTLRIAALGASTTFNAEVSSNSATWPAQLQRRLEAAYPTVRIEVINAAVGGYVSTDNLKNLVHRVLPLSPDLVIYYEANNEIVKDTRALALERGMIEVDGRTSLLSRLSRVSLLVDLAQKNCRSPRAGERGRGWIRFRPLCRTLSRGVDTMRTTSRAGTFRSSCRPSSSGTAAIKSARCRSATPTSPSTTCPG